VLVFIHINKTARITGHFDLEEQALGKAPG
jgi:hypothetical protein